MEKQFILLLLLTVSFMATAQLSMSRDPGYAQSVASTPPPGSPNNVGLNDNASAFANLASYGMCMGSNCYFTEVLKTGGYNFNIPVTASITGIEVQVSRYASIAVYVQDSEVKLTVGGTTTGTNMANPAAWGTTAAYATYGGPNELWGATWTPTAINTSAFGVAFKAYNYYNNFASAYVNHIFIKVYYLEACTGLSVTATNITNETSTGANNGSAKLTYSGTGPYNWKSYLFNNFTASGTAPTSTLAVNALNPGNWKYVITDANSCKDSVAFLINSAPVTNTNVATALQENKTPTGFRFHPNPASDYLTIELNDVQIQTSLVIYNSAGKVVATELLPGKTHKINTSGLTAGMYLIRLNDEKQHFTARFIKE